MELYYVCPVYVKAIFGSAVRRIGLWADFSNWKNLAIYCFSLLML